MHARSVLAALALVSLSWSTVACSDGTCVVPEKKATRLTMASVCVVGMPKKMCVDEGGDYHKETHVEGARLCRSLGYPWYKPINGGAQPTWDDKELEGGSMYWFQQTRETR